MSEKNLFFLSCIITAVVTAAAGHYLHEYFYFLFVMWIPYYLIGIHDVIQTKRSLLRNYPVFGHGRYILEILRPKLYQYFVESDINGRPYSRTMRSIVYQRAKGDRSTSPFGTQENVYEMGHEWINHSMYPVNKLEHKYESRVMVGGPDCTQPYNASILNISAMSYGSLSPTAVESLNWGAKLGGFAHNTGEGSISPYHLKHGGDLIWQIGTGYFGCRDEEGNFSPEKFKEKATLPNVKMIEIKLSQGAKPGKGGILPAVKNTEFIAKIRGVKPHVDIISPANHKAFSNPDELIDFIKQLRDLSGGKPVGFKICVGDHGEFKKVCEAMVTHNTYPDYIAVDGAEGGTGAAPIEFANSVGTPMREGLAFVHNTLVGYGIREHIKIIASGKITTAFHIARAIAMGADMCYMARVMMMAIGCIQALECNSNHCPVGVATTNKGLYSALVPENKSQRVAHFHGDTIKSFEEMLAAAGVKHFRELNRGHIFRRISMQECISFEVIYPYIKEGSLLKKR
jgi:glutamate synthase domain-containing protein 2